MMRLFPTLFTGCGSRLLSAAIVAVTLVGLPLDSSRAQSLSLRSLSIPHDIQPGRWVSFQVKIQSQNRAPRELVQRLAIVASEGSGEESGVWAELKTVEAGKTRIERGFFGQVTYPEPSQSGDGAERIPAGKLAAIPASGLLRYQVLTPDGKLYEYPLDSEGGPRFDEDISAMDLFDFVPARPQDRDSLGADTLRVGRKVIPCRVDRIRRYGEEEWSDDDTSFVSRAVMTRSFWRNPAIPVTGYARSVLEVSSERVRAASRTTAPVDSAPTGPAPADSVSQSEPGGAPYVAAGEAPEMGRVFYRAEVMLLDLGDGAVPEVTQEPEPAPTPAGEKNVPSGPGGLIK